MTRTNLKLLTTPVFIAGLALLLLNDFILKGYYGNWLTGKLSDFAGLFVFTLFWMAIFPGLRKQVLWSVAIFFIWWKSPWSDGFIRFFQELFSYHIVRVVDLTDLIALVMLPIASHYHEKRKKIYLKVSPVIVAIPAVFAFVATSPVRPMVYFMDSPVAPVIAWQKSSDSLWVERIPDRMAQVMRSDSIEGYATYQGWFGAINDLHVAEFKDVLLFRVGAVPIWGERPKRLDDFEKSKTKVRLSDYVLPDFRNAVRPPDDWYLRKLDTFFIKTSCFGYPEEMSFKNSKLHGPYKQYFPEGQLKVTGTYYHGLEDGKWTTYTQNGQVEQEVFYTRGQRTKQIWYSNGEPYETKKFKLRRTFFMHSNVALWSTMSLSLFFGIRLVRPGEQERLKMSKGWIFLISFLMPFLIKFIQGIIPVFHQPEINEVIINLIYQLLIFIVVFQVYNANPRSITENVWLSCFLIFAVIAYEQWVYLKDFPLS
jgi:hypothetical protein